MKKFILPLLVSFSSIVSANEHLRYIGFDLGQSATKSMIDQYNYPNNKSSKVRHASQMASIYTGYSMGNYAAFELGAMSSKSLNRSKNVREGRTNIDCLHMGFVFWLPISNNIELIPGIGVAHVMVHATQHKVFDTRDKGIVPRLVFGGQYKINEQLRLRASANWHRMSGVYTYHVSFNQSLHFGLGLNYSFHPK